MVLWKRGFHFIYGHVKHNIMRPAEIILSGSNQRLCQSTRKTNLIELEPILCNGLCNDVQIKKIDLEQVQNIWMSVG